jgi:hypothetical protein
MFCLYILIYSSFVSSKQVLHAFATEGAHCSKVREILNSSDVSPRNSRVHIIS